MSYVGAMISPTRGDGGFGRSQSIRLSIAPPSPQRHSGAQFWADPFRPFFLLGWTISLISLLVWPLFFAGLIDFPARSHSFLMIQGFFAAFAVGFLWTALPRMLEVPGPGLRRIVAGLILIAGNTVLHLSGFHFLGHVCFLGVLGLIAEFGLSRFPARRDLPPPSFVLVVGGLLLGGVGTVLVALGEAGVKLGYFYGLGRLLLMEVFLLFLVLGVAAFLAPRFLRLPSKQSLPDSRTPSKAWKLQALLAGIAGGIVLAGAAIQAGGWIRLGSLLIALSLTAYLLYQVPLWRGLQTRTWMANGLRVALLCSLAAPWTRFVWPEARIAAVHLLLLGGFGLLTLIVGTRVVFGHSGYSHLFKTRLSPVGVIVGLYMASLVVRLAGEVATGIWAPLLFLSALLLLAAHVTWGWLAIPKIFLPRDDDASASAPTPSFPIRFPVTGPNTIPKSTVHFSKT